MDIEPALTAEEWKDVLDGTLPNLAYELSYLWGEERPVAAMAICNAALGDDDPRKITRDDVEELRLADERIRGEWDHPNNPEPPTLRNLAAKLAAFLPPE